VEEKMSVITIAREFGAGGRTLGGMVAKEIGYTVIDEEIVEMVALEANVSSDWVNKVEKETGTEGMMERMLKRFGPFRKGYVNVAMEENPGYIDGNMYISLLHKVIPVIADGNNVVIIGRGSQYILGDRPDTYHFLMVATLEHRIKFMMEHYNLDRKQAQIVVEKQDKRRLNLYRYFSRTDYNEPYLYDMVFNMDRVSLEEAKANICHHVTGNPSC
jgi:cytidylate kinase